MEKTDLNWEQQRQKCAANKDLQVSEGKVTINGRSIFQRQVVNAQLPESERRGNILFLHAGCYSSLMWLQHGSMHVMADKGYKTAAIDMPGTHSSL